MTSPPVLIIAEAGVNHNGQRDLAFSLIDAPMMPAQIVSSSNPSTPLGLRQRQHQRRPINSARPMQHRVSLKC